jgi:hypothetical protein
MPLPISQFPTGQYRQLIIARLIGLVSIDDVFKMRTAEADTEAAATKEYAGWASCLAEHVLH